MVSCAAGRREIQRRHRHCGRAPRGQRKWDTRNGAAELARRMVQVAVPTNSRAHVSAHKFWKRGVTVMFDVRISNLDAGSYLRTMSEKALVRA